MHRGPACRSSMLLTHLKVSEQYLDSLIDGMGLPIPVPLPLNLQCVLHSMIAMQQRSPPCYFFQRMSQGLRRLAETQK
jgi:hypothetical protein